MKYKNTVSGIFIDRPNRFIAHVEIEGNVETVHVKNTGRCKELLLPGSKVTLEIAKNQNRKTKYDLISVYKKGLGWVNIDSQIPNKVVNEWLLKSPKLFNRINKIKPEFTYGKSRVDFFIEYEDAAKKIQKVLLEVKGCTLEKEMVGYFPDAPTQRGVKHLKELADAIDKGYESFVAFVIAMPKVKEVRANVETHPEFGNTLEMAKNKGVKVLFLECDVTKDSIEIIND